MKNLRFAIFGTGFWSRFQLAAWQDLPGVECIALYNRTLAKAGSLGEKHGISAVYDDPEELLKKEKPDFIDIITDVNTHCQFVTLAARHRIPVICQKPMAPDLETARSMVETCRESNTPLFIHENWRWQYPIRQLKAIMDSGRIGTPFRGKIHFNCSFPVFDNQPFLKELDQFILTDMGCHIFDAARFLFGEADVLTALTHRIHTDIRGEDVATVLVKSRSDMTVSCEISYSSRMENEQFPGTSIVVEGSRGSVELTPDFWLRTTTEEGTHCRKCPPPVPAWADSAYAVVHSSILECNRNLLGALLGTGTAETTGADNFETLRWVFASYESARTGRSIPLDEFP